VIFYFKEVRFSSLRIFPVPFGTGREHTSAEREQVTNVITQQGREENSVEFGLLAWPKENSATWTLLKRTNFPTR
jgi:hypothetical protein